MYPSIGSNTGIAEDVDHRPVQMLIRIFCNNYDSSLNTSFIIFLESLALKFS